MRFVSPLLKRAVYPALHRTGLLNRITPSAGYAVVNYHGVVPPDHLEGDKFLDGHLVQPLAFRRQLRFLKAHYRVVHPEDFHACLRQGKSLPPHSVLVTCDDGLLNTLTDMLPILQREEVPCLFFVTAASCKDSLGMLWYEELYPVSYTHLVVRSVRICTFTADGSDACSCGSNFLIRSTTLMMFAPGWR